MHHCGQDAYLFPCKDNGIGGRGWANTCWGQSVGAFKFKILSLAAAAGRQHSSATATTPFRHPSTAGQLYV